MSSSTTFVPEAAPTSLDCYQRITDVNIGDLKRTIAKKKPGRGRPIYATNGMGRRIFVRIGNWQTPGILSAKPEERNPALRQLACVQTPFHYTDVDKDDPSKFKDSALILVSGLSPEEIAHFNALHEDNVDYCFANQKELFGDKSNLSREIVATKVMPLIQENNGVMCLRVKAHFPSRDPTSPSSRTTDVFAQTAALTQYEASIIQKIRVSDLIVAGCSLSGMTVMAAGNVVATLDAVLIAVAYTDPAAMARDPTTIFGAGMTLAARAPGADEISMAVDGMDTSDGAEYLGNTNA